MSIKTDIEELRKINVDIKRSLETLKKLRNAKKKIEKTVTAYLKEHNIPGVKHNGNIILLEKKNKNVLKPKKERQEKLIELLQSSGIHNSKELADKIKNLGKQTIETSILKIQ